MVGEAGGEDVGRAVAQRVDDQHLWARVDLAADA